MNDKPKRGAPRQKTSMRTCIRKAMVVLMVACKFPTTAAVRQVVQYDEEYNPKTLGVQCSQVRKQLFRKLGLPELKIKRGGNVTDQQLSRLQKSISTPTVQKRLSTLAL